MAAKKMTTAQRKTYNKAVTAQRNIQKNGYTMDDVRRDMAKVLAKRKDK